MAAPKGAKIPRESLAKAEEIVQEMWDAVRRAPTSKEALAGHLGHKNANSGAFAKKLGLLRYFGLVDDLESGQIQISEIGRDVQVPERREEARRSAFFSQGYYKELIANFAGHEMPSHESIATTLHYDYELQEDSAEEAAAAFLESARMAGLVDGEGRVTSLEGVPPDEENREDEGRDEKSVVGEEKHEQREAPARSRDKMPRERNIPGTSGALPAPQVRFDLSGLNADEIIRVLASMGLAEAPDDN